MSRSRLAWIDAAITILIILVIVGHCNFSFQSVWYWKLRMWIYSFHMAAFFFIAGFLVSYSYHDLNSLQDYWYYVCRRLVKFGIPFVILGCGLIGYAVWREHGSWHDYILSLYTLISDPMGSKVIYLWFVYVLLMYYILSPVFCQYYRYSIGPAVLIAVYFAWHPLDRLFAMHAFSRYLIFFLSGIMVCHHADLLKKIPQRIWWCMWIPFLWFSVFCSGSISDLWISLFAIPCLYVLSCSISRIASDWRFFEIISRHCFSIYLYQMIFLHLWSWIFIGLPYGNGMFILFMLTGIPVAMTGALLLAYCIRYAVKRIFPGRTQICV